MTMAIGAVAAPAAGQDSKAILVLHTYGHDAPGRMPFDVAFARAMREARDVKLDLYVETLDPNRFGGVENTQRTRAYLREKYADKKIAVVVAVYGLALDFLLDAADPIFPGVPVAATLTRHPQSLPEHVAVIWSGNVIGRSVALALQLHPETRQIAVIDGALTRISEDAPNSLYHEERRQIEAVAPHVPVVYLRHLPLDEVLARVQELPPETIMVGLRQYIGRGGKPIDNFDGLEEVARVAPAPMYIVTDPLLGTGAVGGVVISIEREASQLARLALRLAENGSLHLPPVESDLIPMFDWRQLRRWGIDERLLPAGSDVRFRQLSVWEEYRSYIVGAAALLALQSALIAGLVVQRAKQRRTELALRESEQHFRVMADTAPVLIWRSGVDNACDFFNKAWLDFRGRTLEQEQRSGWTEGIHPDDVEHCRHVLADATAPREPFQKEYRLRRADGEYRWVLDVGVARYDDAGRFAGFIGSAIDITDRKRIEESFRESEAALRRSYEQNQDLAGRLINAQEAERTRIARDLHDDVSQQLAGVGIMLSGLKRSLHRASPGSEIDETVAALQERTATLAHAIRDLSHELHPGVLKHAGLAAALTEHCAEIQRHHGLTVTFNARDDLDALDFDVALCLYRVTQEALTNIVRHARASVALVELMRTEAGVELRVIDDGLGFVASERSGSGLGLRSIDERVRLTGGHVTVASRPGQGTNLLVRIPVLAAHAELVS